jgi:hypothetical protein
MRFHTYRLLTVAVVAAPLAFGANQTLIQKGTGLIRGSSATVESGYEIRQGPEQDAHTIKAASGSVSVARVPAANVPRPAGAAVIGAGANFTGFDGITHADQRLASNGNQFSLEPPDQGLAVGNGFVVEAVNLAVSVYSTGGAKLEGPAGLNDFFGLAPPINRSTGVFGPFTSDPRVYYDAPTGRWFLTMLSIDTDPKNGDLLGNSQLLIAVSQTSNPTAAWSLYAIDTTDGGNPGCPCFGDQPLIGADQNGFYVTTNEFSILGPEFNGAQFYAISKSALESHTAPVVVHLAGGPLAEGISYSVQPATTPPGGSFESANGGTEYFLSALEFTGGLDNRIAVWALTNTSSLNSTAPNVTLTHLVMDSEIYGAPPAMQQKPGPLPLADLLKNKNNPVTGVATNEHLELIESNDDRMQQTVFAAGKLWSSLSTVVKTENGPTRVGVAWFIVTPSWSGTTLSVSMAKQGYLAANQNNLAYPSIGVNAVGTGLITFTLVGPDFFPSAAYSTIDAVNGVGTIQIAAAGAFPDDGFTGYSIAAGRSARWGDYSAAVADADGSVWMAVEYIPNRPRTVLANWGTFIGRIFP